MKDTNKYQHKLFIDTVEITDENITNKIYAETDKYSITPKTFQSRTIFSKLEKESFNFTEGAKAIIRKASEKVETIKSLMQENNTIIEKGYEMGIFSEGECKGLQANDAKFQLLNTKLTETHNDRLKFEFTLNSANYCVNEEGIYEDLYENNSGNKVVRYGLNSPKLTEFAKNYNKNWSSSPQLYQKEASQSQGKKSGKSEKNESSDKILSFIEIISIQKAFEGMQLNAAKTALIDIFEKDEKGKINFNSKTKLPETHTVVLYKNSEKDFVIIDPTDSSYSTHIASYINKMLIGSDISISASQKNVQIYFPKKDQTGANPDQYRDCIDIAVKVAFGLNNYSQKVDPAKIAELSIVKEISNQTKINEDFFLEYGISRIRQASIDDIRTFSEKFINKVKQQLKSIASYKDTDKIEEFILDRNIKNFSRNYSPEEYKTALNNFVDLVILNQQEIDNYIKTDIKCLGKQIEGIHFDTDL